MRGEKKAQLTLMMAKYPVLPFLELFNDKEDKIGKFMSER